MWAMNILSKPSKLGQANIYQSKRKVRVMCGMAAKKLKHDILILSNKIYRLTNLHSYIIYFCYILEKVPLCCVWAIFFQLAD